MKQILLFVLSTFVLLPFAVMARQKSEAPPLKNLQVVELFTSQGCSSCPPADRVLAELAVQYGDSILPLSFHVDYWNKLGWKDPFSSLKNTQRQYNYRTRFERDNVYTPQAVVNGMEQMNGTRKDEILQAVSDTTLQNAPTLTLSQKDNELVIEIGENYPEGYNKARITLIEFIPQQTTAIKTGENKGKNLMNYHSVTSIRKLGRWNGFAQKMMIPMPDAKAVAVILQAAPQHRILAAAKFIPLLPNN